MDLGSILLALAVIIPVGVLVSRPFLQRNSSDIPTIEEENVKETSALLTERERLINMLQELEFDYTSGKSLPKIMLLNGMDCSSREQKYFAD
jgi:hypothetical protein